MPAFMILFDDALDVGEAAPALRDEHIAYFVAAGPTVILGAALSEEGSPTGRMLVAEFPSLEAARAFAENEPLVKAGRVKQWRASAAAVVQKDGAYLPIH